jgi:hypothetical protein
MRTARRMGWWVAVPVGIALGLALALALDRAAAPASAQGGRSGVTLSAEQLRTNQRISQAAVKRANRANRRLDRLQTAATAGTGPAGPRGPGGPAGPGPGRIAYSAAAGSPAQTVLDLAGVTISAVCETGPGGETVLTNRAGVAQGATVAGTSAVDSGTDPSTPGPTFVANFQLALPAGPANVLGEPLTVPDGEYGRVFSRILFVTPNRTLRIRASVFVDATADRCSFNGVALPA